MSNYMIFEVGKMPLILAVVFVIIKCYVRTMFLSQNLDYEFSEIVV